MFFVCADDHIEVWFGRCKTLMGVNREHAITAQTVLRSSVKKSFCGSDLLFSAVNFFVFFLPVIFFVCADDQGEDASSGTRVPPVQEEFRHLASVSPRVSPVHVRALCGTAGAAASGQGMVRAEDP